MKFYHKFGDMIIEVGESEAERRQRKEAERERLEYEANKYLRAARSVMPSYEDDLDFLLDDDDADELELSFDDSSSAPIPWDMAKLYESLSPSDQATVWKVAQSLKSASS